MAKDHKQQLEDLAADKTNKAAADLAKQMLANMAAHKAAGTPTHTHQGKK